MNLVEKAIKRIKFLKIIEKNDRIIIGCSGGPDSVFLLEVLLKIKEEYNLTLILAHVNHLYRGELALRDENFVKKLGEKHNISVFVDRKNIEKISKEEKITLEEAGREVRYSFFEKILKKVNGNKIALAHNLDDQVETFLFRFMRGSSLSGLEGIATIRGKIIRPICEIYKEELLKYLEELNLEYMIDHTNFESDYTRNSIRLELIPFIEKRYNPKFKEKVFALINEIKEVNNLLDITKGDYFKGNKLNFENFTNEAEYVQKKIINEFLSTNSIESSRRKIESIIKIIKTSGSKKIKLDKDYTLLKEYDRITIVQNKIEEKELKITKLKIPGEVIFGDYIISAFFVHEEKELGENDFLTNLKIEDELLIRTRRPGDKIKLKGLENPKKIKEIMINLKIPKFERENIPIVMFKNEIVWLCGIKKSENYVSKDKKGKVVLNVRRKEC